jgi:hypothetical protein
MFLADKLNKGAGAATPSAYQISRSLRFNSADSAYLGRTPTSASNRKTWTWSGWVKRTKLGVRQGFFGCLSGTGLQFGFLDTDVFQMGTNSVYVLQSTQVFRDPSAWYHVVVNVDTTLASNRCKVYINGTQITAWGTNTFDSTIGQNVDTSINLNADHALGQIGTNSSYLDGYMTEINFIDGQALTPSSFGETNSNTGVWQPKAYSGSYSTNGFYVNFSDNSNTTAATLGKDYSGNGNNWIPFNFSVTAGAGNDSFVDSPTSYGTDTGAGGEVRGNYAILNSLSHVATAFANGNLDVVLTGSGGQTENTASTIAVSSGKWYCEIVNTAGSSAFIGIADASLTASARTFYSSSAWGYFSANGNKYNNGAGATYGATWTVGDVIGIALDMDAGTVTFYKNGTSQGVAYSGLTGRSICYWVTGGTGGVGVTVSYSCNFGQRPFAYTAPSDFKALCTQNLPTPTIGETSATQAGKYFNTVLYTGTGSSLGVTGVGFQPDWVWVKGRSGATDYGLYDAVRGVQKQIETNTTTAETTETTGITAFGSDGFTTGALAQLNTSSATYVAWNWKANGAGSSNTAGSITSTVSANTTSGFSIVNWTGSTSSSSQTVGHGLGVTPSMVILKNRSTVDSWYVYFSGATTTSQYLTLNGFGAVASAVDIWGAGMTSTLVGVKPSVYCASTSDNVLMYCFAPIAGYSAFGSYTGNGSTDGAFIYLGFRPRFVMVKQTNAAGNWLIWDTARSKNQMQDYLSPNSSSAELNNALVSIDALSNGFKCRTSDNDINGSGDTYIYAAFAENPLKYSLAR